MTVRRVPGEVIHHEQRFELRQIPMHAPENLEKYAEIDPNFPERVLLAFEAEGQHRRKQQERMARNEFFLNIFKLVLAFMAVLCVLGVGCFYLLHDAATQGAGIIGAVVVALALAFLGIKQDKAAPQDPDRAGVQKA